MNSILEYPLEALAFNYLSFGFFTVVNNVWAWVAVVTAAVSFWRIKTSSTLPSPEPRGDFSGAPSPSPSQMTLVLSSSTVTTEISYAGVAMNKEEGTKGKLTVYYKQDHDGEECDVDGGDGDQEGQDGAVEMWFENWENLLKMRNGEMGWYRYQDMKIIDGNVVRLWDGCRQRRKAETTAFSVGVVRTW